MDAITFPACTISSLCIGKILSAHASTVIESVLIAPLRTEARNAPDDYVAVCKSAGFDEYYILPGLDIDLTNKGIQVGTGASKSALKNAFKKNATSKTLNRPLLNKFIGMVA